MDSDLCTGYPQDIHNLYTGYTQCAEWCRVVKNGAEATTETMLTDGFKAGYRGLSQRFTVTEITVQSTVQSRFVEHCKERTVRGREA